MKYSSILKMALGSSLTLSYIGIMISSLIINYDNDKLGIAILTHPLILLYLYFLIKTYIKTTRDSWNKDQSLNFLLMAFIGMLFPIYIAYMYYLHRVYNFVVGISLVIVVLWIVNIFNWFLEKNSKKDL